MESEDAAAAAHTHNATHANIDAEADDDTYEQDEFEPDETALVSDADEYASAGDEFSFEEEEVESAPDATVPAPGLEAFTRSWETAATPTAPSAPTKPSSSSSSSSSSSLPSLLPSIMSMSSSLTPAGRAHFAQQASLFAKKPAAATPAPTAKPSAQPAASGAAPTAAALKAYAASNLLQASESLGIHALHVDTDHAATDPSAPTSLLLDEGRLRLWTGSIAADVAGDNASNPATAAFGLLSNVFMRAALVAEGAQSDTESSGNFLHVPITDGPDPISSASGTTAGSNGCVTEEGAPDAELHNCFHVKRLGPYRLRVVARGTSMPSKPDSFSAFMARAQSAAVDGAGPAAGAQDPSPFDVQPRVTLYVAVEKLLSPDSSGSGPSSGVASARAARSAAAPAALRAVLPLLPVDCPHTFWLSTHQASSGDGAPGSAGDGAAASLVFGDAADPSEQLELTLQLAPLHARILDELNVRDVVADARADSEQRDAGADSRRGKKQRKANAKKRSKSKKTAEDASGHVAASAAAVDASSSGAAVPPQPHALVTVSIVAAVADADQLVTVSIAPSTAVAVAPVPSLIDLLATLAVSPSQSLPSSILDAQRSFTELAQITANIANTVAAAQARAPHAHALAPAAVDAAPDSNASLPPLGASWPAAAASVASASAPVADAARVQVQSLERRCAWPFSVSLDGMRVGAESEGHVSVDHALDLLHNRPVPRGTGSARSVLVGDHQVELLRTVGLLCAWEAPRDGSTLNRPVLVSQQPHLSYHVQLRITRLDADEANERAMDAMLDF